MGGFHVDQAPTNGRYTAELFATMRNNGRILDKVRCVLGGNDTVEEEFSLGGAVRGRRRQGVVRQKAEVAPGHEPQEGPSVRHVG